jgi:hypothetical protein
MLTAKCHQRPNNFGERRDHGGSPRSEMLETLVGGCRRRKASTVLPEHISAISQFVARRRHKHSYLAKRAERHAIADGESEAAVFFGDVVGERRRLGSYHIRQLPLLRLRS